MTDYAEEQATEIEALQSIYPDEFEILSESPYYEFRVFIKNTREVQPWEENPEIESLWVKFQYTPTYPDEPAVFEFEDLDGLTEDEVEPLANQMNDLASDNLGMVMIFTLTSAAQEWIVQYCEDREKRLKEEEEEKKNREEEEERKRFEGTCVTVETFLAWKDKFDKERLQNKKTKNDKITGKLTGRELFMQDTTLNESDLKYLDDVGEEVKVDESLFQDLDDLDLGDEDLDEIS